MPKGSTSRWKNFLVLGITTVVILGGIWFVDSAVRGGETTVQGQTSAVELADSSVPAPKVGESAPVFAARTLDGRDIDLADTGGKPVWLVFNATWCSNCRAEIPDIQAMQEQYGDDIEIVSVYVNDSPSTVVEYATQLELTFPQIPDPDTTIGSAYRVMGVPAHYFITADGTIESIEVGALAQGSMESAIQRLLG